MNLLTIILNILKLAGIFGIGYLLSSNISLKGSPFLILKDYPLVVAAAVQPLDLLQNSLESFPQSLGEKVGTAARSGDLMERIAQKFIPSSETVVLYPPPRFPESSASLSAWCQVFLPPTSNHCAMN
ncbi:MAG: hypothetical protein HYT22_02690 [Candidatus Niyogibacteria bacterium]|nr:hypothetical protein [Candidatus Niyogibacteria bacterium]